MICKRCMYHSHAHTSFLISLHFTPLPSTSRISSLRLILSQPPNNTHSLSSAIRQDQLTRLIALIRKRSAIEAAINESHTRLSEAYETASRDLRRAIKIRSEAISDKVAVAAAASEDQEEAKGEDKENEPPLPLPAGERGRGSGQNNGGAAGQDLMEGVEMHGNVVEGFKAPSKKTVERAEGMARKGLRG